MIKHKKIEIKAMKAKEIPLEKLQFPLLAQLKYDGVRLITKVVNHEPTFYTYNGSQVPLPQLAEQIRKAKLDNLMLDGELIYLNGKADTRTKVSGMVNSALHGGTINEDFLSYALFDSMSLSDFEKRKCEDIYSTRYARTAMICKLTKLRLTRNITVRSISEVTELVEQLYVDGFEGLILKPLNHKYRFSRSPHWIKIKETKTADLICIGTTPGTGKYEGMIGALICSGTVEGKEVKVKVGSGLNDIDRAENPHYYYAETIEVKYNSLIRDSRTGQWSLFLPRFVDLRFDK